MPPCSWPTNSGCCPDRPSGGRRAARRPVWVPASSDRGDVTTAVRADDVPRGRSARPPVDDVRGCGSCQRGGTRSGSRGDCPIVRATPSSAWTSMPCRPRRSSAARWTTTSCTGSWRRSSPSDSTSWPSSRWPPIPGHRLLARAAAVRPPTQTRLMHHGGHAEPGATRCAETMVRPSVRNWAMMPSRCDSSITSP